MILTPEQQAILDGAKGEIQAKVMKTLVMYGEAFGADKMVPVTSEYNHLVTSFGLKMMGPVFDLMQQLIDGGAISQQKFSVDPRPLDKNVPANFLQNFIFNNFMYSKQADYEEQLKSLGLVEEDAFTCACYLDQVGNKPKKGDILSWAESSAVVYANSVLGARCNRNSGIMDIMGSIAGFVPSFGLLTDEGRKATWIRWATNLRWATSSAGQSPLLWCMPTLYWVPVVTETPALWTLWVPLQVSFLTLVC
jgi:predicted aconitase